MKNIVFKVRFRDPADVEYDPILPPLNPDPDTRHVLFANVPEPTTINGWEVLPQHYADRDTTRRARHHKCLPHQLFPDAEWSLWLDGVFQPQVPFQRLLKDYAEGAHFVLHQHPTRNCTYAEAERVLEVKKDDPVTVRQVIAKLKEEGFPRGFGLHATGAILRRHCPEVNRFNELWWAAIQEGSKRDQLSFDPLRWRLGNKLKVRHWPGWKQTCPLWKWRPHYDRMALRRPRLDEVDRLGARLKAKFGSWFPESIRPMRFGRPKSYLGLLRMTTELPKESRGLEIGSFAGESTLLFLSAGVRHVTCVDPWPREIYGARIKEAEACFDKVAAAFGPTRVEKHRGKSEDILPIFKEEGRLFDWVYIDGDHSESAVKRDIELSLPLVRKGGLICGHDYNRPQLHPGVSKAVDALLGKPDGVFLDSSWMKRL